MIKSKNTYWWCSLTVNLSIRYLFEPELRNVYLLFWAVLMCIGGVFFVSTRRAVRCVDAPGAEAMALGGVTAAAAAAVSIPRCPAHGDLHPPQMH